MNERTRFAAICAVVVLVLGVAGWLLFGGGGDGGSADTGIAPTGTMAEVETSEADGGDDTPVVSSEAAVSGGTASPTTRPAGHAARRGMGLITGWVEFADGRPGAGLTVESTQNPYGSSVVIGTDRPRRTTRANDDGYFVFDGVPDGRYALKASDGTVTGNAAAIIRDGRKIDVVIILADTGTFSGRVTDADGNPVAGASVLAAPDDGRDIFRGRVNEALTVVTGDDGAFEMSGVPGGPYVLLAEAKGYAAAMSESMTADRDNVALVLGIGGVLAGQTVDAITGDPVGGVRLIAAPRDITASYDEVVSGDDGVFRFESIRPGPYVLTVDDPAYVLAEAIGETVVETGAEANVTITVSAGGMVTGKVINESADRPAEGIWVRAFRRGGQAGEQRQFDAIGPTRGDGTYSIQGLPPGQYDVTPEEAGGLLGRTITQVMLAPGQSLNGIDLPMREGVTIRGIVRSDSGRPVDGAIVSVINEYNRNRRAFTDSEGRFTLVGIAPFDMTQLQAEHQGVRSPKVGPILYGASGVADVELTLADPNFGTIAGTVVDASGTPVDASVDGSARTDVGTNSVWGRTDSEGRFVLRRVAAGAYQLSAHSSIGSAQGSLDAPVAVDPGQNVTGVQITLEQAAQGDLTISGVVIDSEDRPVSGAQVYSGAADETTDSQGVFLLTGLPAGEHRVAATHPSKGTGSAGIAAGTTDAVITLAPPQTIVGQVLDDATGQPITHFGIAATSEPIIDQMLPATLADTTTFDDPQGRFALPFRPRDREKVTVFAQAEGYVLTRAEGLPGDEFVLRMKGGRRVSGRVENGAGEPLAGAYVFEGPAPMPMLRGIGAAGMTDANGAFVLNSVGPRTTQISAVYPGLAEGVTELLEGDEVTGVVITVVEGATVEVRVALNDWPVNQISVNYRAEGSMMAFMGGWVSSEGVRRIEGVAPGPGSVTVSYHGRSVSREYWTVEVPVRVEASGVTTVHAALPQLSSGVEGVVTRDGAPIGGELVRLYYDRTDGGYGNFETNTNADGVFEFAPMPAGSARLSTPSLGNSVSEHQEVILDPGRVLRQDLVVPGEMAAEPE